MRQPRFATNTARARARDVLRSQNAADAPACPRRRQRTAHACARVLLHRLPAHHGQACGCACTRRTPRQHHAQHRRHTKGAVTDLLLPADVRACMVALAHSQCARQVVRTASTGWACRTSAIMVHRANEWVCGFEVGLGVLTNTTGAVCTPALPLEHSVQGGGGGRGNNAFSPAHAPRWRTKKYWKRRLFFPRPPHLKHVGGRGKRRRAAGIFWSLRGACVRNLTYTPGNRPCSVGSCSMSDGAAQRPVCGPLRQGQQDEQVAIAGHPLCVAHCVHALIALSAASSGCMGAVGLTPGNRRLMRNTMSPEKGKRFLVAR